MEMFSIDCDTNYFKAIKIINQSSVIALCQSIYGKTLGRKQYDMKQ